MKQLCFLSLLFFSLGISVPLSGQNWLWANGSNAGGGEGYCIAADDSGNVYVTGEFATPTLSFGTNVLVNTSQGTSEIFLVKFDASGNITWARSAGGRDIDEAYGVTVDASGAVYVTGVFYSDTLVMGSDTLFNAGGGWGDIFLVKYDPAGNILWARSAGGTNNERGTSVATDASGNVFVTGSFYSSPLLFGSFSVSTNGSNDVFLVKYDTNGNVIWASSGGGSGLDFGSGVCCDNSGNLFITGYMSGLTATFGSVTLNASYAGSINTFLVKYNSSGNPVWGRNAGNGLHFAEGNGVAATASGNCFVTGEYDSTITFGTYTLTTASTTSNDEAFIVDYDASGNVLWAKTSKTPMVNNLTTGYSVSTDVSGNVYQTGGFMNATSVIFDTDTLYGTGGDPMFIVKYDASGNILCSSSLSSGGDDNNSVVVRKGIVYTGGDYINSMIVGADTLHGGNTENIFVARYSCDLSGISSNQIHHEILIYPNPSSGIFQLQFSPDNFSKSKIEISDVLGNIIYTGEITEPTSEINLTGKSAGIYFYKISNQSAIISSGKLIIEF